MAMKNGGSLKPTTRPSDPGIEDLLHPAALFSRPQEVVDDLDLTLDERRAILSSWASDACAVEAAPALRRVPESGRAVTIDEILDALCALDRLARDPSRRRRRSEAVRSWIGGKDQDQLSLN
jgi:hypothetical protein